jgi:hypothetical protein
VALHDGATDPHVRARAVEVQVAPLQRDGLGDAQARAGDQLHEKSVRGVHEREQRGDLRTVERAGVLGVVVAHLFANRQGEPAGGVVPE